MPRGFTLLALLIGMLAVGYDRFVEVGALEGPAPVQDETYQSADGGDWPPPPPPCPPTGC
jgi:hypothetical protein